MLVAIAIAASRWRKAELEQDIAVAVARSFIQLTAIGYVIDVIFEQDNAGLVIALLAVMVVFGAFTARRLGRKVPCRLLAAAHLAPVAAVTTLGLVLALGIFEASRATWCPVGGMVIGNSMTAAAVASIGSARTSATAPARSRRRWRSGPPRPRRCARWSGAACARG